MIPIEKNNRINWEAIRAEYIGSDISQRKLAAKYHIKEGVLLRKANRENWAKHRENARNKAVIKAEQKTAEALSDNAAIAARIKTKLLLKLEREIDSLPDKIGSELFNTAVEYGKNEKGLRTRKESSQGYKLRDLTAAYKDLTDDMQTAAGIDVEDLSPLVELLR